MKVKILILSFLLIFSLCVCKSVKDPNKPAEGVWDFNLTKNWQITNVENEVLARPDQIAVSEEENIYLMDGTVGIFYIFSKDGKFLKKFGPRGEGPGEVKHYMRFYLTKDGIVVADVDRLHFFTKDGEYLKSQENFFFANRPEFFLNNDEFITFPLGPMEIQEKEDTGKIRIYNLKTQQDTIITEFKVFTKAAEGGTSILKIGLTPLMNVGFNAGENYLCYGMSDSYNLKIVDLKGKELSSISQKRAKIKVTSEIKEKMFANDMKGENPSIKQDIMKKTPNESTYFFRIEAINGLIYVFIPDVTDLVFPNKIDIFSKDGKYLYNASIDVKKDGVPLFSPNHNFAIKNDHLYIVLETEKGDVSLVQYTITLPKL